MCIWLRFIFSINRPTRETLPGKGIPGIPLSFQPVCDGGKQVALQLINKLEELWFSLSRMQRSKIKWKCCRLAGVKRTWSHPRILQRTINVLLLRMTTKE